MHKQETLVIATNTPRDRVRALDLARGIAIFAMVVTHVIGNTGSAILTSSAPCRILNAFVSIVAAPVFMFIMGVLMGFPSKPRFEKNIVRGFSILGLGYLLNFFRGMLPVIIGLWSGTLSATELDHGPWHYLLEIDILQFAGLAMIALALARRYLPWPAAWCALGALTLFGSPWLWNIEWYHPIGRYALSLFAGGEEYSFFPVFPWITFPLVGMAYGAVLKNSGNRQGFFFKSALAGGMLLLQFLSGSYRHGKLPPAVLLTFIGCIGIILPLCQTIALRLPRNPALSFLYYWSENVMVFYCIQWILIGWLCVFLPPLSWPLVLGLIVGVLFLTDRILISFARKKPLAETVPS
jgi:uncharacterized membrane protein